ncbi:MAG: glycerol-3-phosphate dehydrogenase [Bacteroidetes bacterium 4572_77]|nr:MAG: glycerol-3-phosphate dehydrogenase [Bacteroidetes bacterium 4572_77]
MENRTKICIIGAGAMGTSMGNALALKQELEVVLLSNEEDVVESINKNQVNEKYFPSTTLSWRLRASTDVKILSEFKYVFLAIPSSVIFEYIELHKSLFHPELIMINLAKGLSKDEHYTIAESLMAKYDFKVATFKGPTFARELINNMPTAFTVGATDLSLFPLFKEMVKGTCIHLDYSTDVRGVELLSVLKNIYAIALGIVDAQYDSPNLRFLFLTKAFSEMRAILIKFEGKKKTLFKYCGYGDFGLTALNDLSRNRTLGLLIGKGFFSEGNSNLVLEGKKALDIFYEMIKADDTAEYQIIEELNKVLSGRYDIANFIHEVLEDHENVPID